MVKEEDSVSSYTSVDEYYSTWEFWVRYKLMLGRTRHHGYYTPGT